MPLFEKFLGGVVIDCERRIWAYYFSTDKCNDGAGAGTDNERQVLHERVLGT